jgi:hypothetical protein
MIAIYLTEAYLRWGLLFLRSLRLTNGIEIPVVLNTRGLNRYQVNELKDSYGPKLKIINKPMNMEALSKKHNIPMPMLEKSRASCEGQKDDGNTHRLWMNLTADGDRITSFKEVVHTYKEQPCFLHMDIDLLFRGDISPIFDLGSVHDVGLIFRKGSRRDDGSRAPINQVPTSAKKNIDSIISIACVCIRNNENGLRFMDKWASYIEGKTPMINRNVYKWGQYAIWEAYKEYKEDIDFFRFPTGMINTSFSQGDHARIWYPKTKKGKEDQYGAMLKEYTRLRHERQT